MHDSLEDRSVLVTGAGSGIGLAIARALVVRGARILVNDIDGDRAHAAARLLGERCLAHPGDAADPGCVADMVTHAVREFGRLDCAVANAGVTLFGDVFSYDPADFRRTVAVNLQGTFFLAQSAARHMRERAAGGRILFMSSVLAVQPHLRLAPYCMTKAGISMLARTLALELAPWNIAVNALAPGATVTERTLRDDDRYVERWQAVTPSGRPATPEDIARAAVFLLSSDADHVTGQTLVVDGGWSQTALHPHLAAI